jgi:hypothetical protein
MNTGASGRILGRSWPMANPCIWNMRPNAIDEMIIAISRFSIVIQY